MVDRPPSTKSGYDSSGLLPNAGAVRVVAAAIIPSLNHLDYHEPGPLLQRSNVNVPTLDAVAASILTRITDAFGLDFYFTPLLDTVVVKLLC
jgi:hypothetical protein